MLVVVIVVRGVAVRAVKVVDVIAVHDGLMPAPIAVGVVVPMVGMTIVQVVDVAVVLYRDVAAGRPVRVVVIGVRQVGGHGISFLSQLYYVQYYANTFL